MCCFAVVELLRVYQFHQFKDLVLLLGKFLTEHLLPLSAELSQLVGFVFHHPDFSIILFDILLIETNLLIDLLILSL